jgi:thiamine-phosphate pyrophosphorylase
MSKDFLLAVITSPGSWDGEAECLEELLRAGLEKLHLRKPGGEKEALLERLAQNWASRLVLHGGKDVLDMAMHYGIPQVHGHWYAPWAADGDAELHARTNAGEVPFVVGREIGLSASVHSWEEVAQITPGVLEYVFLSPLFDSISKPGYKAGKDLLQRRAGVLPCKLIGLGGIDQHTIGQVIDHGWDGAAVLGYIWDKPQKAVERFKLLKAIVENHGR